MAGTSANDLTAIVDGWFNDKIKTGGRVARDVDTFNEVFASVEDLKDRLVAATGAPQAKLAVAPIVPTADKP
jgi:hypothetical protein